MSASGKVNSNFIGEPQTPLSRAGDAQDRFVETLGDKVMRQMASILDDKDLDAMARVGAGKAILEWIRPKKNGPLVQVNTGPTMVSHLNLPAPEVREPLESEAVTEAEYEKVLPEEPKPMEAGKLATPSVAFEDLRNLEAKTFARPMALVPRSPTQRTPDAPPAASTVKPYR